MNLLSPPLTRLTSAGRAEVDYEPVVLSRELYSLLATLKALLPEGPTPT